MIIFENNWARSPFKDHLYEPVLKLHMRDMAGQGRPTTDDDASFVIWHDPSIEPGQYSRPPTQEEIDKDVRWNAYYIKNDWFKPIDPYRWRVLDASQEKNILTGQKNFERFHAVKAPLGAVLRVKIYGFKGKSAKSVITAIGLAGYTLGRLEKFAPPSISIYPKELFLYAYVGYIQMQSLIEAGSDGIRFKEYRDIQSIELCMHAEVMWKVFNLSPAEYPEVEPRWHCITNSDWPAIEMQA